MIVYVAIVADRHTDTEPYVFSTADAAIKYARHAAVENSDSSTDIEEETMVGWLYYARYSEEGDAVWVIEKEIDNPEYES